MKTNPVSIFLSCAILAYAMPSTLAQPTISNFMAVPADAQVALTWNRAANATGYNVKQASSATGPLTIIATNIPNTGLVVTNLRNNTLYFFTVSEVSGEFESADAVRLRAVPSAAVLDLLPAGAKIEKLASGYSAAEGPVWDPARGELIFSDSPNDRLLRWTPGVGATIFRQPSNRANGNTLDLQGRLISCEIATRSITRTEVDGTITPLVTQFNGKRFNEPNDLVVKSDGTIWFTDPSFGNNPPAQPGHYVYRFDPADGNATVTAVVTNLNQPNGLCFALDEKSLLVADTSKAIRLFDVLPDNSLTNSRVFIPEGADGMRVIADGRLFICKFIEGSSMKVFGPDAQLLGALAVPEPPTNLCLGGTNREMLFITASSSLYGITRMPDLIVSAVNPFPANPVDGKSVAFSVTVKNQGTAPTLEGVPIRVAFSMDGATNAAWAEFNGSLPPDAAIVLSANHADQTPAWTPRAGVHSIKAIVDSVNAHRESNETNNVLALTVRVAAATADSDADGLDDPGESTAGTDPAEAASVLKILAVKRLAGDRMALTWSSVPRKNYRVSHQAGLGSAEPVEFSVPITATTAITSWTNHLPFPRPVQFLRILVIP